MEEDKTFSFRDKRRIARDGEEEKPAERKTGAEKEARIPPRVDFSTFVLSLSSSAAMHLGGFQDPVSGHVPRNLELAKQSIDILGILKEKTKGNLTGEEEELLDSALYELRMNYIEETKKSSL